jgi:hypothetical protein
MVDGRTKVSMTKNGDGIFGNTLTLISTMLERWVKYIRVNGYLEQRVNHNLQSNESL